MATVTTPLQDARVVDKQPFVGAYLNSKLKRYIAKVTFGAAEDYATGGIAVDLKLFGVKTIYKAVAVYADVGCVFQYDRANGKIVAYGYTPTDAGAGSNPLTELDNADQALRNKIVEFEVEGV